VQPTRVCGSIGLRSIGAAAPQAATISEDRTLSTELGARWSHRDGLFSVGAMALPTDAALGLDVGTRVALSRITLSARAGFRTDEVMTWRGTAELPIAADFAAIVGVVGAHATAGDEAAASDWITGVRWSHRFAEAYVVGGGGMSGDDGADWAVNAGVSFQLGASRRAPVVAASPYFTPAEPDDDTIIDVADDELRAELPVERDEDTLIQARPAIEDTGDELVAVGEPIFFKKDRKRLRRAFQPALDAMVAHLEQHPELELIDIEGHADATGPTHWNLQLSRLRAQAVADYLVARGIDEHRLHVSGAGDADPHSDLADENRRVVFRVLTRGQRSSR
jgi:outer membrane protein OmpA-like peptidoglycan-associated protein